MRRNFARYLPILMALPLLLGLPVLVLAADATGTPPPPAAATVTTGGQAAPTAPAASADSMGARFIAIALMVAGAVLGAGYAVGRIGAAVIGALSEKPELFGRSIIFIGLAEGLAIYGLLMGLLLLLMK